METGGEVTLFTRPRRFGKTLNMSMLRSFFEIGADESLLKVKEWYDGYHFGNTDIYCPWDVIQYCKSLYLDAAAKPQDFWSNLSGNAIVRRFIDKADISTKK